MANLDVKRILNFPEQSTLSNGDYVAVDSSGNGTKKYNLGNLLQPATTSAPGLMSSQDKTALNQASSDITDLKEAINQYIVEGYEKIDFDIIENSYPKNNGTFGTESGWDRSDYIPVIGGETIYVMNGNRKTVDNAFYDSNKTVISMFTMEISSPFAVVIPSNCAYIVISNQHSKFFGDVYRNITGLATKKEFNMLSDSIYDSIPLVLESGSIDTAHGTNYSNNTALRTQAYIDKEMAFCTFQNCKVRVFAYQQDGTYIGLYNGSGYEKDWSTAVYLTSPVFIGELPNNNYKFRLVFDQFVGSVTTANASAISRLNTVGQIVDILYYSESANLESGALNTASGANTANDSALRTKDFINTHTTFVSFQNCKVRVFAYRQDGTFVGIYTGSGFVPDWTVALRMDSPVNIKDINGSNNYKFRLVFDQFTGSVTPENANVVLTIDRIQDGVKIYTVGAGKDFLTFTSMLKALKDDLSEKKVYVYPGVYDIFSEIGGASYIASLSISGLNWRDVSDIVPPNTEIIGLGNVVLSWNPTDTEIIDQDHAFLFSPLNLSGSCKIKNIKIDCSNCRYGIHDETSGLPAYDGITRVLEDVTVVYHASTYGVKYAYGAGHNKNSNYKYKNCVFSAAYGAVWSAHDWTAGANEKSVFDFDNCVFVDNRTDSLASIRFSSSDTVGRLDDVNINACAFGSISFSTEGSTDVKQGYQVRTMCCMSYTTDYTAHIQSADRIAPKDYIVIS